MPHAGLNRSWTKRGFTLVELLLTVALIMLLLGAVVFNFSTQQRGAALDEGATQFEALLRFARAHAAATGRQVQIQFEEDLGDGLIVPLGNLRLLWEPDPVERPGWFEELREGQTYVRGIADLVTIEDVRPADGAPRVAPGNRPLASSSTSSEESREGDVPRSGFAPISFYPDGSSDSAEIHLASRDPEDKRILSMRFLGVTGTIRLSLVTPETFATAERPETFAPGEPAATPR